MVDDSAPAADDSTYPGYSPMSMIYDFECTSTCKPGTSPKTIGGVEVCTDCQEELNVPGCSSCDFSTSECTGCFSP